MDGYGVGIIGCGRMGQVWVETVAAHPRCHLVSLFDPDPAAAASRAEVAGQGVRVAASLDELVAARDINLVVICTPSWTHPDVVERAAQAGKHILCEKPMALTLAGCQQMLDACCRAGVVLAIGQTLRFWGAFLRVRELVRDGCIGTPCLAQVLRGGAAGATPARSTSLPPTAEQLRWRYDTRYSGGDILEGVIHELDFSRALLGEVSAVYATVTGVEEYQQWVSPRMIQAVVDFEAGGQATVRMGATVGYAGGDCWVAGTEGTLVFGSWDGPVRLHRPGREPEPFVCPPAGAYLHELRDLLAAIESGGQPENSGSSGMRNVGLGLAIYQSVAAGQRLGFSDGLPTSVAPDYQYRGPSALR